MTLSAIQNSVNSLLYGFVLYEPTTEKLSTTVNRTVAVALKLDLIQPS